MNTTYEMKPTSNIDILRSVAYVVDLRSYYLRSAACVKRKLISVYVESYFLYVAEVQSTSFILSPT